PRRAGPVRTILLGAARGRGPACSGVLVRRTPAFVAEGRQRDRGRPLVRRPGVSPDVAGQRDDYGPDDLHQSRPAVPAPVRRRAGRFRAGGEGSRERGPLPATADEVDPTAPRPRRALALDLAPGAQPPLIGRL